MCGGGEEIYDPGFINSVITDALAKGQKGSCLSDCKKCFNDFCRDRRGLRIDQINPAPFE